MAVKRTKKQKENVRHQFLISWDPDSYKANLHSGVKGQLKRDQNKVTTSDNPKNIANFSVEYVNLASIKSDIIKSLSITGFILASELVLYLVWR